MGQLLKIATVSTKGGVGKTTIAANIGGLLADLGHRVLLVDTDPQPTLSTYFTVAKKARHGLLEVISTSKVTPDAISQTVIPNLDVIQSNDNQGQLPELIRSHYFDGRVRLYKALTALDEAGRYDYVVIDTQGSGGPLQDIGIAAADMLLSPIPPEALPAREFYRGTVSILRRLGEDPGSRLANIPLKVVINSMNRTRDAASLAEYIREQWHDSQGRITVAQTQIPRAKAYTEAATRQVPVHQHEVTRQGQMPSASEVMHALTWELFPNLAGNHVKEVRHG